jgi:hypothetical protein
MAAATSAAPQPSSPTTLPPATEAEVVAACTTCHAFPPPEVLPRSAWRDALVRMALIREGADATPSSAAARRGLPPDLERILEFYERHAPRTLARPRQWPAPATQQFARHGLAPAEGLDRPAISHVQVVDLDGDGGVEIVAADMRYGMVLTAGPEAGNVLLPIAQLSNPAHLTVVDFDGDGVRDLVAADLGEFLPADHKHGAVAWLRAVRGGKFETLVLDGWPRVASVALADFNGDGTRDLAVAAFGWRTVGNLTVLDNHTTDFTRPSFEQRMVDPRPGAIHTIPADLDRDGRMDLVTLFAQQFEQVMAYINTGARKTTFTPQVIYSAPHPNWGSSGIELVDLDKDGDLDVLMTHGDTFDDDIVKPYHGILWLENQGTFPFKEQRLADLPGASRARAGDLDGDGDLDIVAGAFVANGSTLDQRSLASLVWLEQVSAGTFQRRTLEQGAPRHATLDLADIDADGDLDIVVGNFVMTPGKMPWVEVWENLRNKPDSTR